MSNSGDKTNPSYNPFAVNTTDKGKAPVFGNQPNPFAVNTNGNASTSAFGNMTNSTHNSFAVNTTGNASMSVFGNSSNQPPNPFATNTGNASMSVFGNSSNQPPNPFAVNTNGNASMSVFGNSSNQTPNPFAVNTNGNASMSVFGNSSNQTPNPFAVNTNGNASMSVFGNSSNQTLNPFAVNTNGNVFGNSSNQTPNPFAVNSNDNTSMSVFGSPSNQTPNPFAVNTNGNVFGNSSNQTPNPFAVNTNGNVFGNSSNQTPNPFAINSNGNTSMSVFGSPSNPSPNPFAFNTNGNASMSVFGNSTNQPSNPFAINKNGNALFGTPSNPPPNPFAVKPPGNSPMPLFGNTNNSTCNPFPGNTTSPSFPYRGITFDGTSTGAFGALPSLTPPSIFGPKETSGSPAVFTNHMGNNAFGWGPGGSAPSSFSQSSGLKFGQPSNAPFGTKGLMTSTSAGTNTSVSNAGPFSFGFTKPSSSQPFSFGVTQASTGLNKGSKIKPYAATKNAEKSHEQFLSISSMPVYASKCHEELRWEDYELKSGGTSSLQNQVNIVSTGSSFSPTFQFPTSTPVVSSIISPTTLNPFSPSPILSFNFTPSSSTTAASLSNSAPSSTTTPSFTQSSSPFQNPSFPIQSTSFIPANPLNLIPPSTSTPSSCTKWPAIQPLTPTALNVNPNTPFPTPTSSFNFTAPSLIQVSSTENSLSLNRPQPSTSNPWLNTQPSTLTETGKSQINVSGSTSTDKAVDCIIAVKDPFGPQSVSSHPLTDHRICSPLIQHGISCMPVIDKPATTRISSLVTSRHISQRPLTVRARKYNPKSEGPKVPFFDHIDEIPSTQKESTFIIPRESPRSVFEATPKLSTVSCAKADVTDASTSLHDGRLKSKTDEASSSTPCKSECQESVDQKRQQVNPSASVPKLHQPDYYTQPSIAELLLAESNDPGFCSHVQDFVVGRHGYGEVKFEGETDLRGLDLDALVYFNKREVIVYDDEHEKPEIGEGLNKRAEVTLLNVKCSDKTGKEYESGKMVDKFLEKLKKVAENQGAEFVSYDAINGVWKFQVQHF